MREMLEDLIQKFNAKVESDPAFRAELSDLQGVCHGKDQIEGKPRGPRALPEVLLIERDRFIRHVPMRTLNRLRGPHIDPNTKRGGVARISRRAHTPGLPGPR